MTMRFIISLSILFLSTSALAEGFLDFFWKRPLATYEEDNVSSVYLPLSRAPSYKNVFVFSPKDYGWAVYNQQGKRVGLGKASGGKKYCDDIKASCMTVVGEYTVFRKEDRECTSQTFPIDEGGGAPMPYCMFFYKGYAIHGSNFVSDKHNSHGCIRVSQNAAKWISTNYITSGSLVIVLPY